MDIDLFAKTRDEASWKKHERKVARKHSRTWVIGGDNAVGKFNVKSNIVIN